MGGACTLMIMLLRLILIRNIIKCPAYTKFKVRGRAEISQLRTSKISSIYEMTLLITDKVQFKSVFRKSFVNFTFSKKPSSSISDYFSLPLLKCLSLIPFILTRAAFSWAKFTMFINLVPKFYGTRQGSYLILGPHFELGTSCNVVFVQSIIKINENPGEMRTSCFRSKTTRLISRQWPPLARDK